MSAGGFHEATKARYLPADLIVPVIRDYLAEYQALVGAPAGQREDNAGDGTLADFHGRRADALQQGRFHFATAIDVLADEAGVNRETIRKYLNENREWVKFDIADRLMCAMGKTHLFYVEPLASAYAQVDLSTTEERKVAA